MGFKKPSLDVTGFVDKPGWYHVIITGAKDGVQNQGSAYTKLQLQTSVLASSAGSDQVKRHLRLEITNPDAGMKDNGEFSFACQCRLAIATDCYAVVDNNGELQYANVADVPEGQEIERLEFMGPDHEADPENVAPNIVDKQMIVKVKERKWESGEKKGTSYELDGAHIYHVEDPEAAAYPKDGAAIAQGGYKLVQAAASGAATAGGSNGNGAAKPSPAKPAKAANPGTSEKAGGGASAGGNGAAKPAASATKPVAGKTVAAASDFDKL
jgi:hypothetical protein